MNTKPTFPQHIYSFSQPHIRICVSAPDLASAIDELRLHFGYGWVQSHIDSFDVNWFKPNKK